MNLSRRCAVMAGLMAGAAACLGAQPSLPATSQIDSLIRSTLASRGIAGAAITIMIDGRIAYQRGYGLANRAARTPVDPAATLFGLSSISKVFTAVAVLREVEQGRITLDQPVATYLPELELPGTVTVAHLLTHTAGFDELMIGTAARRIDELIPLDAYLRRDLPPIVRTPGTTASYSNHGFAVAGLLVQRTSGQEFARYLHESVLNPLDMTRSGFEQPLSADLESARAAAYRADGSAVSRIFYNDAPAGAMFSTAADMGRFMQAFVSGPGLGGVLRDVRPMQQRQFTHHAALNGLTFGLRQRRDGDVIALEQGGASDDYSSDLLIAPDHKAGLFVALTGPGGARLGDSLWKLIAGPVGVSAPATNTGPANADGVYRLNRFSRGSLARMGVLTGAIRELTVSGSRLLDREIDSVGPALYRLRGGQLIAFRRDASGEATHLFLDSTPYAAYERVRWWERRELHVIAFVLCLGAIIVILWRAAIVWPLTKETGASLICRRGLAVGASAAAILLIGVTITILSSDVNEFQFGLPTRLNALLAIGSLSIPASVVALATAPFVTTHRVRAMASSFALAVFAALIMYWQLLPRF